MCSSQSGRAEPRAAPRSCLMHCNSGLQQRCNSGLQQRCNSGLQQRCNSGLQQQHQRSRRFRGLDQMVSGMTRMAGAVQVQSCKVSICNSGLQQLLQGPAPVSAAHRKTAWAGTSPPGPGSIMTRMAGTVRDQHRDQHRDQQPGPLRQARSCNSSTAATAAQLVCITSGTLHQRPTSDALQ